MTQFVLPTLSLKPIVQSKAKGQHFLNNNSKRNKAMHS